MPVVDRELEEDDHDRVHEEHETDLGLGHRCLVLRVDGEELEPREAGEDEQSIQADDRDEGAMPKDVAVRACAFGPPCSGPGASSGTKASITAP